MTTLSWKEIPHIALRYTPDVTLFWEEYIRLRELRQTHSRPALTLNTLLLRLITEGLKAAPSLKPPSVSTPVPSPALSLPRPLSTYPFPGYFLPGR